MLPDLYEAQDAGHKQSQLPDAPLHGHRQLFDQQPRHPETGFDQPKHVQRKPQGVLRYHCPEQDSEIAEPFGQLVEGHRSSAAL